MRDVYSRNKMNWGWGGSLTDCLHDVGEETEGHEGLGKLAKEKFQSSRDDMNVLPITLVQIQLLFWGTGREEGGDIQTDIVRKSAWNARQCEKERQRVRVS